MEATTDSDSGSGYLRLVVFPWLAFGHLHPFLELSKLLASRGHYVTFISTPRNIQRLPHVPSHLSSLITFVPLPLPRVDPLPETAEATTDIPQEHVQHLEKAFDGLAAPFLAFIKSACSNERTKPDWIVMDIHHHWLPKIAQKFCVPCTLFSVVPASSLVFDGPRTVNSIESRTEPEHFTVPPSWIPFPCNLAYHLHEASWMVTASKVNASGISMYWRLQSTVMGSSFVSVRGCFELNSKWLSLLSKLYEKDVVPVGLLPPPAEDLNLSREKIGNQLESDAIDCLDKHPPKSVLYIALGSEATLSTELLHELALGLEKSAVPFLWALRKPAGTTGPAIDMLPVGFQECIKGAGHVSLGWVHLSTFIGLIARLLEERGVSVEVPRDNETGNFDREDVARVVCRVLVEEEGELIRRNAEQIPPIYTDKVSQEKHIDGFIRRLQKC